VRLYARLNSTNAIVQHDHRSATTRYH
jgi:hypothetical protein